MAKHVTRKIIMSHDDILLYQIMTYCFEKNISLSKNEMSCLVELCKNGESELSSFCMNSCEYFSSPQTIRNFISKAVSIGLVQKNGTKKKKISINPEIGLVDDDAIIIDQRIIYVSKKK